ncbi:50S ribosomal protein L22 [Candidatus Woesearchaeota archaeon]|nr:50S ribosomal protein L22 [Candidatus Woesearchaeota archaeon]
MAYKYSTKKYDKENMARAVGRSIPISTKFSVEICNLIRNKKTGRAKEILKNVIAGKEAIEFKRFKRDLSHKKGMGPGRYPKNASIEILKLIECAEANAQFKGINTSDLYIPHINAQLASRPWRYGRQRRRKAKRTHIEIIVQESENKKAKEKGKKEKNKEAPKKEPKKQKDAGKKGKK